MKKLVFALLLVSCEKKEVKPKDPEPQPTPVTYYRYSVTIKAASYSKYSDFDTTYFQFNSRYSKVNNKKTIQGNIPVIGFTNVDSVKKGDKILIDASLVARELGNVKATFNLEKVWLTQLGSPTSTVLISGSSVFQEPVVYTDSIGHSSHKWEFIVP